MSKNFSLIKTSLYYWLELQLATLFSVVATTCSEFVFVLFPVSRLMGVILVLIFDVLVVCLLVFWRFQRTPAHEADSFQEYLIPCLIAFGFHLLFGIYPFVTSVGLSASTFARLVMSGFQVDDAYRMIDVPYGMIWKMFALFCTLKFGAVILAYFYRKRKDRKKHYHSV